MFEFCITAYANEFNRISSYSPSEGELDVKKKKKKKQVRSLQTGFKGGWTMKVV